MYRMRQSLSVFSSLEGPWWLAGISGDKWGSNKEQCDITENAESAGHSRGTVKSWLSATPDFLPAMLGILTSPPVSDSLPHRLPQQLICVGRHSFTKCSFHIAT